jgi:hypothetical protein
MSLKMALFKIRIVQDFQIRPLTNVCFEPSLSRVKQVCFSLLTQPLANQLKTPRFATSLLSWERTLGVGGV